MEKYKEKTFKPKGFVPVNDKRVLAKLCIFKISLNVLKS